MFYGDGGTFKSLQGVNSMTSPNALQAFIVMFNDTNTVAGIIDANGAQWRCPCGREANIKRDGVGVTGGNRLDCPACGRRYFQQTTGNVYEMEC